MANECALAFASSRVPNLEHAVFGAADHAQVVGSQSPDAFEVTEESAQAAT
jgi:hypothetical protein